MDKRFNIRVYGIWMHENKVLINEELIRGKSIIKFPGGGLNWGEGTKDCLKREWQEELGIEIDVPGHFYTTDFFQPSAYDNSQLISIYYWVAAAVTPAIFTNSETNERAFWINAADISADTFTLPIDKLVGGMLQTYIQQADFVAILL